MKKIQRQLAIKCFHVEKVEFATKTSLRNRFLSIYNVSKEVKETFPAISEFNVSIINPHQHHIEINSIMDIIPISTKVLGELGTGITHTLTGVYIMLTGADESGKQFNEFGSSEGLLDERLTLNKAGTPGENDIIIHVDVILKGEVSFTRNLAFSIFQACDLQIQTIRECLKMINGQEATERYDYCDKVEKEKTRIAIVKQVAGQGAMYDNLLFSKEPSGTEEGISIIDIGNMPIVLSPNEYRDGALRSLT